MGGSPGNNAPKVHKCAGLVKQVLALQLVRIITYFHYLWDWDLNPNLQVQLGADQCGILKWKICWSVINNLDVFKSESTDLHKCVNLHVFKKEEEFFQLRAKLQLVEGKGSGASEQEINMKVTERTQILKHQLEKKLEECQRMAEVFIGIERRRMEERILQQQQEVEMLRRRLEEIEFELCHSRDRDVRSSKDLDGSSFARSLMGIYADEDPGMVKSMDQDIGDAEPSVCDVKHLARPVHQLDNNGIQSWLQKNI